MDFQMCWMMQLSTVYRAFLISCDLFIVY